MRRQLSSILLALSLYTGAVAQSVNVADLTTRLRAHPQADTLRVDLLLLLAKSVELTSGRRDSLITEAQQISEKIAYTRGKVEGLLAISRNMQTSKGLQLAEEALQIAEKSGDRHLVVRTLIQSGGRFGGAKALTCYHRAIDTAKAIGDDTLSSRAESAIAGYYNLAQVNYPLALEWAFKALQHAEKADNLSCKTLAWRQISQVYIGTGDQEKSLHYLQLSLAGQKQLGDNVSINQTLNSIGERFRLMGSYPEALKAYQEALQTTNGSYNIELYKSNIADVYERMGDLPKAFYYAYTSRASADSLGDTDGISWIDGILGRAFLRKGWPDSALWFAHDGYKLAKGSGTTEFIRDNAGVLTDAYAAKKDFKNAYDFHQIYILYRDSMSSSQISNQANLMQYNYDLEKKQAEIIVLSKDRQLQVEQVRRQRGLLIASVAGLGLILGALVLLIRNNGHRRRAYALLEKQKQEIQAQRDQTNQALAELQTTQNQLVQSEKMASLGELTAGIAHEIQNPLNFVNNFSEVSIELLDELKDGPLKELNGSVKEETQALIGDISQNLEKINYHGRRADAIVKGMLHHSRNNSQKELTDINALADEYMRLSYHGLRAKDKTFNAATQTSFDPDLPKIMVIPQDVGRVLLNLFTNAFYSVAEKKKRLGEGYEPTVTVATRRTTGKGSRFIEITVSDNGMGIPQKVLDKIYQPFFTTKPTGQGTGLGLSMSYDIVTKSHGGEIRVDTKEGEFAAFTIQLPA